MAKPGQVVVLESISRAPVKTANNVHQLKLQSCLVHYRSGLRQIRLHYLQTIWENLAFGPARSPSNHDFY